MIIKKETRSVLHSDPFQLQIPSGNELGLAGGTNDHFYTFSLKLSFGAGGVEERMPLYAVENAAEGTKGCTWYRCFALSQVPALNGETSELRLFFENGITGLCDPEDFLYENFTFFVRDQGLIASWDESDPLFREKWSDLCQLHSNDERLNDRLLLNAAGIVKQLLAAKFPFCEITNPVEQIPGYKPEYHDTLFG